MRTTFLTVDRSMLTESSQQRHPRWFSGRGCPQVKRASNKVALVLGLLGSFSLLFYTLQHAEYFCTAASSWCTFITSFFLSWLKLKYLVRFTIFIFELQLHKSIELVEALFLRIVKGLEKISMLQDGGKLHIVKWFYHFSLWTLYFSI